jgi:hypothetical protein
MTALRAPPGALRATVFRLAARVVLWAARYLVLHASDSGSRARLLALCPTLFGLNARIWVRGASQKGLRAEILALRVALFVLRPACASSRAEILALRLAFWLSSARCKKLVCSGSRHSIPGRQQQLSSTDWVTGPNDRQAALLPNAGIATISFTKAWPADGYHCNKIGGGGICSRKTFFMKTAF